MKLNIVLGFVFVLMMAFSVSAQSIGQTELKVKFYNNTVEIIDNKYSGNDRVFTVNISNDSIVSKEHRYTVLLVKNESVDSTTVEKYTQCLNQKSKCEVEKAQFNSAWSDCRSDLKEFTGENATKCEDSLSDLKTKSSDQKNTIQELQEDKKDLEEEIDSNSNKPWFFGLAGIVVGIVGWRFWKGEFGSGPSDKTNEFNKGQAG